MASVKLAGRYAKSLLDLAVEKGILEAVAADIEWIASVCRESREFTVMLKNPVITADKKLQVLEAIFGKQANVLSMEFFKILVRKGRERYLPEIAEAFVRQYQSFNHITAVELTSASPLNADTIESIRKKLVEAFHLEKTEIHTEVDPSLKGGFILKFDHQLLDASVSRKLNLLRQQFTDTSYIKQI